MSPTLTSDADANNILDHFNGFHDGFIKEVSLRSQDTFEQHGTEVTDIGHVLTGRFDAMIAIAHYNYGAGTQPYHRIVRCEFTNVKDFLLDLRNVKSEGWPIKVVEIQPGQRENEQGRTEPCFFPAFIWSKLVDNQWTTRKAQVLTFEKAEFREV